jgi:hypothetical protein
LVRSVSAWAARHPRRLTRWSGNFVRCWHDGCEG